MGGAWKAWMVAIAKLIDIVAKAFAEWHRARDEKNGADKLAKEIEREQKIREEIANDIRDNPDLPDELLFPPSERGKRL